MSLRQQWHYDEHTGKLTQVTTGDIEPLAEENLIHRNAGNNGFSKERTVRKIGSIPMHLLQEAYKLGINPLDGSPEAEKWVRKILADNIIYRTVDNLKTNRKHILR